METQSVVDWAQIPYGGGITQVEKDSHKMQAEKYPTLMARLLVIQDNFQKGVKIEQSKDLTEITAIDKILASIIRNVEGCYIVAQQTRDNTPNPWEYGMIPIEDRNFKPIEWLVEDVLMSGGVNLYLAKFGTGKNVIIADIFRAIAEGRPDWAGHKVNRQARCLMVDHENPGGYVANITRKLLRFVGWPFAYVVGEDKHELPEPSSPAIQMYAKEGDVIGFDSLRALLDGDENDSGDIRDYFQKLIDLRDKNGITTVTTAHTGKDAMKGARGSSDIGAVPDYGVTIEKIEGLAGSIEGVYKFSPLKVRGTMKEFCVRFDLEKGCFVHHETTGGVSDVNAILRALLGANPNITLNRFQQMAKDITSRRASEEFLKNGVMGGFIRGIKQGNALHYALASPDPDPQMEFEEKSF